MGGWIGKEHEWWIWKEHGWWVLKEDVWLDMEGRWPVEYGRKVPVCVRKENDRLGLEGR
jgi:hypothetical protein